MEVRQKGQCVTKALVLCEPLMFEQLNLFSPAPLPPLWEQFFP